MNQIYFCSLSRCRVVWRGWRERCRVSAVHLHPQSEQKRTHWHFHSFWSDSLYVVNFIFNISCHVSCISVCSSATYTWSWIFLSSWIFCLTQLSFQWLHLGPSVVKKLPRKVERFRNDIFEKGDAIKTKQTFIIVVPTYMTALTQGGLLFWSLNPVIGNVISVEETVVQHSIGLICPSNE